MCTTYLGAVLCDRLESEGFSISGRFLIRLNPNAKHKTRGNAAVCIECTGDRKKAFDIACGLVEELAEFDCENTNPGVVVSDGPVSEDFYFKALRDFCTIEEAEELLEKSGSLYRGWKIKRGLIGAAAAVSAVLPDFTFELLAYRDHRQKGIRCVDKSSVFLSEEMTTPHTWDSVDTKNRVVVCVPHTPDPVLYGIRGDSPEWVLKGGSYIAGEIPVRKMIYQTNQGTDAHLIDASIAEIKEGRSYRLSGTVSSAPVTGTGGHVSFELEDGGFTVRCMAYEPTKNFRDIVRELRPGDRILVCGSYKGESINLEKICIDSLAEDFLIKPPLCGSCKRRMTSAGLNKGYKCRICGAREAEPEKEVLKRTLKPGWYEVPPVARRHLSKPLVRGMNIITD
ncbi:DUF1743 domain-containing protein [Methanoplanus sp. FWC-SCC4]|uniref:tRNA(Ile2) 2-agmatinylcytidine synthetase TiaS n=1 Tax=Methanochimaera problematica TaxID=2609417 RepID=A0AA97FDJ5_9EURY|nr:tRNA(Ile)(2)-agmatinylcytidine synthase [Methanoplanus sp. FWC-SCC4]WOF17092.1 DUF1743 domain-containing protein [Methanoplanus sp. FWC-SCC4]